MNSPEVSVVEPQSVPSRISVVLAEEAKVGDAQRVQRPRGDQDLRLLAGEAKPARVIVCDDSHLSPSVEGTLSPCDSVTPGPVTPMRTFPRSHQDGGECMDMHGAGGLIPTLRDPYRSSYGGCEGRIYCDRCLSNGVDDCEDWNSDYQRDIIEDVSVYYDGDSCDSEESDWEDPEDVARRERVDDYNFDLLEGMEPIVFVPGGYPSGSDRRDEYINYLDDGNDARVPDDGLIVESERKAWREYCASIYRKRFGPMGVRRDELLSVESDCEDTYHVAGWQYFDVPDGMDLMRPTAHRLLQSEITVDVDTRPHVDHYLDGPDQVDVGHDVRSLPDAVPAMLT